MPADASDDRCQEVLDACGKDVLGEGEALAGKPFTEVDFFVETLAECAEDRALKCGENPRGLTTCGARDGTTGTS